MACNADADHVPVTVDVVGEVVRPDSSAVSLSLSEVEQALWDGALQ